jgi:hypothetical protein
LFHRSSLRVVMACLSTQDTDRSADNQGIAGLRIRIYN